MPVIGKALSSSTILLKIYSTSDHHSSSVVHYGENINYLDKGRECIDTSCVIDGLEEDTLYYFKLFGIFTEMGEPADVIRVRTLKKGSLI